MMWQLLITPLLIMHLQAPSVTTQPAVRPGGASSSGLQVEAGSNDVLQPAMGYRALEWQIIN